MKKLLALLTAITFMLSGCVIVDHNGHCPPGQAKKGRC